MKKSSANEFEGLLGFEEINVRLAKTVQNKKSGKVSLKYFKTDKKKSKKVKV